MLTRKSLVNKDGGGKALGKLKSTHPNGEFQETSQRAREAGDPMKLPKVPPPHCLQNIGRG